MLAESICVGHAFTSWTTVLTLLCRELQFIGHLTKEVFPVGHCNCANAQKQHMREEETVNNKIPDFFKKSGI
jgi:hypothetical protein